MLNSQLNQRALMAALKQVQQEMEAAQSGEPVDSEPVDSAGQVENAAGDSALDTLVGILGLSTFERKVLLMCAGVELDGSFARLVGQLNGSATRQLPSFGMALSVFGDAHWSALSPDGPLRYWHLVELEDQQQGQVLTQMPLKIDEPILFYLTGVRQLDDRLRRAAEPVAPPHELVPSQLTIAEKIIGTCSASAGVSLLSVMQLDGNTTTDKAAVAAYTCSLLGLDLFSISALAIPTHATDRMEWARLWNRQAALNSSALFVDLSALDAADRDRTMAVSSFIEHIGGLLFIGTGQWIPRLNRPVLRCDINKPTTMEQLWLWKYLLERPMEARDGALEKLVGQFDLSASTIRAVSVEVAGALRRESIEAAAQASLLWKTCCAHTRPHVEDLAQRIEVKAGWNDIVLPEEQKDILREIAAQVNQRNKVYGEWGFSAAGSRGLGISVLFSGESGTGKTMASEVLASELQLDLYRIDLSQVVNKYIGETEKNLKRVFDAAEEGGAVLLFDEADALFGKRGDVKDSHDRYGNIEVSYLLQRMEAYRGLAILTTNMKSSIDKAFFRRIRFVVQFPFPDATQRAEIWRKVFPASTPTQGLDVSKLARMNIAGGNIRNIALNAAFIAANEGRPVHMAHVGRAARSEYAKLGKPLNNLETGVII
ncbi:ATP-binding protein [Puia dinghuensis]|nr:ATP-binding protein [Puia dinghuensis]